MSAYSENDDIAFASLIFSVYFNLWNVCSDVNKKRPDYLEWPEYFMAIAFLSAQRSKDPATQVGWCFHASDFDFWCGFVPMKDLAVWCSF